MGLFLGLSGVVGGEADAVRNALGDFARSRRGGFELVEGNTDEPNIGIVTRGGPNTTVMYPNGFCEWDDASKYLSERLAKPVFSLHIHDGDLWMFILFREGREIGWFNPIPEYWGEISAEEKEQWKGDAALVAEVVPLVSMDAISGYFVEWDLGDECPERAYSDDGCTVGDCWQMADFMKKIGLEYPMGSDGSVRGDTFRLWTEEFGLRVAGESSPSQGLTKKSWWRFW